MAGGDESATRRLPSTAAAGTSDQPSDSTERIKRIVTEARVDDGESQMQRRLSGVPSRQAAPRARAHHEMDAHRAQCALCVVRAADGVRNVFEALGRESTERISKDELLEGLERLKLPSSRAIVREIFAAADADGDGFLEFKELLVYVQQREAEIAAAFSQLTPRVQGSTASTRDLSFADVKRALGNLGVTASDRQIAAFMTYLDQDESGTVSLAEFTSFVYLLPRVDVSAAFESWLASHAFTCASTLSWSAAAARR